MMGLSFQDERDQKASPVTRYSMRTTCDDIRRHNSNGSGQLYRSSGAEAGPLTLRRHHSYSFEPLYCQAQTGDRN